MKIFEIMHNIEKTTTTLPHKVPKIMAIVYTRSPDERLLALKLHPEPGKSGGWFVVTGAVEPGETLEQAVRREVREETGISSIKTLVDLAIAYQYPLDNGDIALERVFGVEVPVASEVVLNEEHIDFGWCAPAEFIARLAWDGDKADLHAIVVRLFGKN